MCTAQATVAMPLWAYERLLKKKNMHGEGKIEPAFVCLLFLLYDYTSPTDRRKHFINSLFISPQRYLILLFGPPFCKLLQVPSPHPRGTNRAQATGIYLEVKAMGLPGDEVYQKPIAQPDTVAHACDLSTCYLEMGESGVQDQLPLS